MSYQKESFGMMDEGYFVPRGEILDWINNLLDLHLNKIQQLGSGAVYCQIVDVIHPGKVGMNKINWKAKNDYEFINNLKLLQNAFDKAGVKRYVQVQKLARAKYQDNLQFIQWLKRYYDLNCGDRGSDYNGTQRRGNVVVDFSFADKIVVPKQFNAKGQIVSKTDVISKKPASNPYSNVTSTIGNKPKTQQKPVGFSNPQKSGGSKNWQALYEHQAQINKDLQMKMDMIIQTLKSQDGHQTKLELIHGIVSSGNTEQKPQLMEVQNEDDGNI